MLNKKEILEWIDQASIDNYIPELQDTYGTEWIEKLKEEIISGRFDAPVSAENSDKYEREGELIRKTVAHDETILYIGEGDDQVIIAYSNDLDDFIQVGNYVKITLELI